MAFPSDLSDVVVFKIHPAIGIARVSKNDDYFVFGTQPTTYKSNGLMKRQAVQFRIFAYGQNHTGLGELTPAVMAQLGITAVWSAEVANRKLANTAALQGLPNPQLAFGASAASNDAQQGRLTGSVPGFAEGQSIPLGQITGTGLFIPPKAGAYRKVPGTAVPKFPNHTPDIADTTSDGPVRVQLSGPAQTIPTLGAWIVVAPGDYSPDQMPEPVPSESLLLKLKEVITQGQQGSPGTPHNETARRIDEKSIEPASSDWAPGFETSMDDRSEVPTIPSLFYNANNDPFVDPREMRVKPKASPTGTGAFPGQLTSGLCSPWQTDFTACVGYWAESLPARAFLDESINTPVRVYRRQYASTGPAAPSLANGDDFERHQDKIGVVRIVNGRAIETERGPGDDLVDTA